MKRTTTLILIMWSIGSCGQKASEEVQLVGGPCEGCEAIFENGKQPLSSIDTLPDFQDEGPKIKISGTVYKTDEKTPAPNVIIYVYHTNQEGYYVPTKDAKGWARRHGRLRGWMKTDSAGHYEFFTLKPAAYPNRSEPMHIHYILLEPGGKYYWIQDVIFTGDPRILDYNPEDARGGDGLVDLINENGLMTGTRNVILRKNIDPYEN